MDNRNDRVRKRAYEMWEQEGRPPGRELAHWDKASELVAIEENHELATIPVQDSHKVGPTGEPVEPVSAIETLGDMPGLTDQGEDQGAPNRRKRVAAAKGPTPNTRKSPRSKASTKAQRAPKAI